MGEGGMMAKASHHWRHDDLANDLARHLQNQEVMACTNFNMGSAGSVRPDVYTVRRSYSRPIPLAYEVKVSRSDFLADVNAGKWQEYLKYAGAVIFACPDGLLTKTDIPDVCGLIVRKENVWRSSKSPRPQPCTPPFEVMMKLLIDGVGRSARLHEVEPRKADTWSLADKARKKFGDRVADCLRNIDHQEYRLEELRKKEAELQAAVNELSTGLGERQTAILERERDRLRITVESVRQDACNTFGLPPDTSWHDIARERWNRLNALTESDAVQTLLRENAALRQHIKTGAELADQRGLLSDLSALQQNAEAA